MLKTEYINLTPANVTELILQIENSNLLFSAKHILITIIKNYTWLQLKLEQGKIINSKFIECESYGDSFYSSFPIYESYILYLSNSHADMNEFNKCYCTSNNSSKKGCKHYIIAMQNSHQSKNVFSECSSYHYTYGEIEKNIAVGIIE